MTGKHGRFRLEPAIVDAIDRLRGPQAREAFVRHAVLAYLMRYGIGIIPAATRPCSICGEPFAPIRRNAHICSTRCRNTLWRRNKKQKEEQAA